MMTRKRIILIVAPLLLAFSGVIFFLQVLPASSDPLTTVFCVKPGGGNGCLATISAALAAAQPGDTIWVATGNYGENVTIDKTVDLEGGWDTAFTTRNPALTPSVIRPANPLVAVVTVIGVFGNPTAVAPTIDGFEITGGRSDNHGGGLRIQNSNAIVSNNSINDNVGYLYGGGVWVQNGAPHFENNVIANNHLSPNGAPSGAGIELENTQATLTGNVISDNTISQTLGLGGGIAVAGGGPVTLLNNTISGNAAATITTTLSTNDKSYGGGVYVTNAPVDMTGNIVQGNLANGVYARGFGGAFGYGGGIYIISSPAFTLTANTIISNTASYKYYLYPTGGGVRVDSSTGVLRDNVIDGNHANGNILFGNGGGLAVYTSTLSIQGGQIRNNTTSINCEGYGGGLFAQNSAVTINTTQLEKNCGGNTPFYGKGGAIAFFNSPYKITDAIVYDNRTFPNDTAVGGIYAGAGSPGTLLNNTLVNNRGQGIRTGSAITLTNNIVMGHTTGISLTVAVPANVTYNDFYANTTNQRGFPLGVTNIVIDPKLTPDFHLTPPSVLIDAGGRSTLLPEFDLDGEPRIMAGPSGLFDVDIGADEFTGIAQTIKDLNTDPADFTLIGPGNPVDNPGSTGSNDWLGYAVLGADLNGDHKDDLTAGAPNHSDDFDNMVNDSGRIYSLFNNGTRRQGIYDLFYNPDDLEVRSWLHQQHIGTSFASADLNGDGNRDLVIGSIGGDSGTGQPITGTVYVFAGGPGLSGIRTLSPALQADWRFKSRESTKTFAARNALAAGQLNGSGPDDLAVAEALATGPAARTNAGAVYLLYGRSNLPASWDLGVTPADLTIYGPAINSELGMVASGDVNGDGRLDLVARSTSTLYIFYGPLGSGMRDLASSPADATITGLTDGKLAVGDLDGDHKADIAAGITNQVVVIHGGSLSGTQTLTQAAQAHLTGVSADALYVADWNKDGMGELLIGEISKNSVYIVFGSLGLQGTSAAIEKADWVVHGQAAGDQFGWSLGSGDLDGDGTQDLILGSRSHVVGDHTTHFEDAGAVYVLYGTPVTAAHKIYLPTILKH